MDDPIEDTQAQLQVRLSNVQSRLVVLHDEERSIRTKIEHLKEAGARGAIWRDKISSALKGNAGTTGIAEAVANVLVEEEYDDIDVLKALDVATCRTILRINGITAPFGLVQRIVDGIRAFV